MRDEIVELDEQPSATPPRRAERFVVGALLSGSLVFSAAIAFGMSFPRPTPDAETSPRAAPAASALPLATPSFQVQPPIFRPVSPLPRPSRIPLPVPDVWNWRTP